MEMTNRRKFISQLSLTTAGFAFSGNLMASNLYSRPSIIEEFVTAETNYGKIKGYREQGVNIYKGIPYAGKTSGNRRFRRPDKLEPWPAFVTHLLWVHQLSKIQEEMSLNRQKIAFS